MIIYFAAVVMKMARGEGRKLEMCTLYFPSRDVYTVFPCGKSAVLADVRFPVVDKSRGRQNGLI